MTTTPRQPLPSAPALKSDHPRRPAEGPAAAAKRSGAGEASQGGEGRKLIVGRDISLSGEIRSCDLLQVDGTVEARLQNARLVEVTETGLFKGAVDTCEAEIAGRFEGELIVHGRLRVRATGRIEGVIRYAELEVEAGGQILGEIQVTTAATPSPRAEAPRLAGFQAVPPASAANRAATADAPAAPPAPER